MTTNSISKSKLAKKYGWSLVLLRKRINLNPKLRQELRENFYNSYQKVFTPLQVEIIYKHLGKPGDNF
ncbi:MAG: DUF4248 domain-containing protein [Bacteroidota bacterium]